MKNPTKDLPADAEVKAPSRLDKINEFGEKNAKAIIVVSTILVIVTVLITVEALYRKAQVGRAERERSAAHSSAEFLELKEKYKDVREVAPLIVLSLANAYYKENKLEDARKAYEDFIEKYGTDKERHPLTDDALRGKNQCVKSLDFLENSKTASLNVPTLNSHPLATAKLADDTKKLRDELKALKDKTDEESKQAVARIQAELDRRANSPLGTGPVKLPHPVLVLKTKNAVLRIELFEDEAPNAVAQIVALAKSKYFDGMKFEVTDDQLKLVSKETATDTLGFEPSARDGDVGSVVLVRVSENGDNKGAEFVILRKDRPVSGETVVGILQESSLPMARALKGDDAIESGVVENLRDHEYTPKLNPKK